MRLTFEISDEAHDVLCRYIPHGMRKYAYVSLIEGLVRDLQTNPAETLHALIGQRLNAARLISGEEQEAEANV